MNLDQLSPEPLVELMEKLEQVTNELNASVDKLTQMKNEHEIAKGEVTKNQHKLNLIKEQIMTQKKLMAIQ